MVGGGCGGVGGGSDADAVAAVAASGCGGDATILDNEGAPIEWL